MVVIVVVVMVLEWALCILRHNFFSSSAAYSTKARLGGIA